MWLIDRGQALERLTLQLLGYSDENLHGLVSGYPDILNQLLEVKVQDILPPCNITES
jgi:hypothetical protein